MHWSAKVDLLGKRNSLTLPTLPLPQSGRVCLSDSFSAHDFHCGGKEKGVSVQLPQLCRLVPKRLISLL